MQGVGSMRKSNTSDSGSIGLITQGLCISLYRVAAVCIIGPDPNCGMHIFPRQPWQTSLPYS